MKRLLRFPLLLTCTLFVVLLQAQTINPDLLLKEWKASWVTVPGASNDGYGVYLFRKQVELPAVPSAFVVHVSADNRYKLFVNGTLVSLGPARGDINHWNYETIDIAHYLQAGKNIIAAKVWNEGEGRPEAQITYRTGFILQGDDSVAETINTNNSWQCITDSSYSPLKVSMAAYYVAGSGEQIKMESHIKHWQDADYSPEGWKQARPIGRGVPKGLLGGYGTLTGWMLVPSSIPQMERTMQRLQQLRRATGVTAPASFPATKTTITIPANTNAVLLLDQTFLTNAYFTLIVSGGKNSNIKIEYSESLFTKYPVKGNRNDIEGKMILGRKDIIMADGSQGQSFTSLTWRTYRYVQLSITTKEDPLTIHDLYGTFTGYPFQFNARLQAQQTDLNTLLDIGWRTARLCAVETYMDCPYFEQLQYIGDARIQALVSLYNSGDDRLLKNALNLMDESRQPEGVTLSRHPSYTPQYIPTFSLWYIGMLHDYWMYGNDSVFSKNKLAGARAVLDFFHHYQQADGSLKNVPYWMFTDWVEAKDWNSGTAPAGKDGNCSLHDLQLLWALQLAADMENKIGVKDYASLYLKYAAQLKKTIREKYWDNTRKLFADRPEKDLFSQHANALAILTGVATDKEAATIAQQLLIDKTLAPASIYFKYYLHLALVKAGLGNQYIGWLGKWKENISLGLTTWAEMSEVEQSRSDCHAWGSSPNIELFRIVLGIDSDAPGFSKIKIEPHLGAITNISGEIPHPKGKVSVQYVFKDQHWVININLPVATGGTFIWKGKTYLLKQGVNAFQL